jgi:hypothetical protein
MHINFGCNYQKGFFVQRLIRDVTYFRRKDLKLLNFFFFLICRMFSETQQRNKLV